MRYKVQQINEVSLNGNFIFESEEIFEVDQKYFDNCIDKLTIKFFRNLGGSEEVRVQGDQTSVISTCPQNLHRTTRHFRKIVTK